jgi:hypothetical protein
MDADEFRKRAGECRRLAAMVPDDFDEAFWLRLAEDWMKIAAEAEKARKPDGAASGQGNPSL